MEKEKEVLPVFGYETQILETIARSSVTIITAATGAGKSTWIPRFLAKAGYWVVVTQPRRLAARSLGEHVSFEMGTTLGDRVGYRTADERRDSAETEILYVTDGLQLVRELAGCGGTGRRTILVLDEVHEWNLNMEVLIAWTKSRLAAGDDLKVVLMSATLDAERLSAYYGGAPVISIPGRLYPVEKSEAQASDLVGEVKSLAQQGRNVLVFQPGKREIAETMDDLGKTLGGSAIILPLHGELEPSEQQRCFASPPDGKKKIVVSTNVAQTSVTIPDIDAVVDSGVERRTELVDNIEGLYLKPISQADCEQRAGRAGRTKAGAYVLCSDFRFYDRPKYPTAEILRSRLDQMVLRLAAQGFDATKLEFFHQPDHAVLAEAKRALITLGGLTADGKITPIGRRMARLPLSVQFARMLVEAEQHKVIMQVATIAACLEAGDIRSREGAWTSLTTERTSDLLAVLDVFEKGKGIKGRPGQSKAEALREAGLFAKDFFRADEIRRRILDVMADFLADEIRQGNRRLTRDEASRRAEARVRELSTGTREDTKRACVAGMVDHLYQKRGFGAYVNGTPVERQLARESVIAQRPDWLVGLPIDIQIKTRRGGTAVLRLVTMATAIEPALLAEVAPQLVEMKTGLCPYFDHSQDSVRSTTEVWFNGQKIREEVVADPEHAEASTIFAAWLAAQMV